MAIKKNWVNKTEFSILMEEDDRVEKVYLKREKRAGECLGLVWAWFGIRGISIFLYYTILYYTGAVWCLISCGVVH